ncbi:hypothetical protein OAW36_04855 [Pelagibacteraceae bacterium]|nr:hypothetical protein [Pelagibacteraceae bacterium]MDC3233472.1 hypothetical protein [Pelagibacteraceae bacterium]
MNINFDCSKVRTIKQYLYPIVRIDEQSINVRIDEHLNKNLI